MVQKIAAAMVAADVATQGELDTVSAAAAAKLPGDIVQVAIAQTASASSGTTATPYDATIPQITEGTEFMTLAFTPTNINSILLFEANLQLSQGTNATMTVALHKAGEANAIFAVPRYVSAAGATEGVSFRFQQTAGSVVAAVYSIRVGNAASNSIYFNRDNTITPYGGVMASIFTITEIKV